MSGIDRGAAVGRQCSLERTFADGVEWRRSFSQTGLLSWISARVHTHTLMGRFQSAALAGPLRREISPRAAHRRSLAGAVWHPQTTRLRPDLVRVEIDSVFAFMRQSAWAHPTATGPPADRALERAFAACCHAAKPVKACCGLRVCVFVQAGSHVAISAGGGVSCDL